MPPIPEAVQHFRAYLQRRNYATHTLNSIRSISSCSLRTLISPCMTSHFVRSSSLLINSINKG